MLKEIEARAFIQGNTVYTIVFQKFLVNGLERVYCINSFLFSSLFLCLFVSFCRTLSSVLPVSQEM